MPDVLPKHAPGQAVTRTAGAAITGGQLVTITGDNTVSPTAGAGAVEGQASRDAAVGDILTVWAGGEVILTAAAAITAGQRVQSAAAGQVAPWSAVAPATAPVAENIIGHATRAAAAGAKVTVRLYNA